MPKDERQKGLKQAGSETKRTMERTKEPFSVTEAMQAYAKRNLRVCMRFICTLGANF
jgi:radical SAM superfamily enzyme